MKRVRTQKRRIPAFRTRIFTLLALFTLIVLLVLWIFQIFLLRPMYESIKLREMEKAAQLLAEHADKGDLSALSDRIAQKANICISVYEIRRQSASLRTASHIRASCILHNVSSNEMMNRLYMGAKNEGYYMERIRNSLFPEGEESANIPKSIIAASLAEKAGSEYLILLNAEIEPVGTTTDTLATQLTVISLILLAVAAAIAIPVSGMLSRPIVQMSREAGKLALGTYDVHFDGGRTKETAELGDALNYAASELSALDSMQRDLIANISHDLRTPLTMIAGYSEVMRDIPGEMTPENIQIVIDETQRLSSLVNDILDLSRLREGGQALQCETISLTETVRATMDRYSKLITHDGYDIRFLADREAYIYADRARILQVLYNLVSNAVNYTGADKSVTIRQLCRDGICRMEITDTGEGIPPEQLPLIWDRYYKVKNYYKRSVTGSGLGLSIVKGILVSHGARFGVESEVGHGSTFWFELPEIPRPESDS